MNLKIATVCMLAFMLLFSSAHYTHALTTAEYCSIQANVDDPICSGGATTLDSANTNTTANISNTNGTANTSNTNATKGASSGGAPTLTNPLKTGSVQETLLLIADLAMNIGIVVAVIMIIYAGFKFVTALGDPGKLGDAKKLLLSVIIGLGILIGAKAIVGIIKNTLVQANIVDQNAFNKTP